MSYVKSCYAIKRLTFNLHSIGDNGPQHVRHVQLCDRPIELVRHVNVSLRCGVALMSHERLESVRGQRLRVDRGEGSPQVVEAIAVARVGMLVFLVAWQVDSRSPVNPLELRVQSPPAMVPRAVSSLFI